MIEKHKSRLDGMYETPNIGSDKLREAVSQWLSNNIDMPAMVHVSPTRYINDETAKFKIYIFNAGRYFPVIEGSVTARIGSSLKELLDVDGELHLDNIYVLTESQRELIEKCICRVPTCRFDEHKVEYNGQTFQLNPVNTGYTKINQYFNQIAELDTHVNDYINSLYHDREAVSINSPVEVSCTALVCLSGYCKKYYDGYLRHGETDIQELLNLIYHLVCDKLLIDPSKRGTSYKLGTLVNSLRWRDLTDESLNARRRYIDFAYQDIRNNNAHEYPRTAVLHRILVASNILNMIDSAEVCDANVPAEVTSTTAEDDGFVGMDMLGSDGSAD